MVGLRFSGPRSLRLSTSKILHGMLDECACVSMNLRGMNGAHRLYAANGRHFNFDNY